jgi:prolipoprotein diacylglyceryltransferase
MEFSLLAAAAIGVFAFWLMLRWEAPRGNAAGCAVDLWDAGLVSATVGLFTGRLAAMVQVGINPFTDPGQILLIRSGISTTATVAATLVAFAAITRSSFVAAADGLAAAALAGLAGWHAGCVTSGSCLGTATDLPWGYALDGGTVDRHPVELYAALLFAGAAIAVAAWKQRGFPPRGAPAAAAIAAASGIRLVTEPMRITLSGGPILLYAGGLLVGLTMVVIAFSRGRTVTSSG